VALSSTGIRLLAFFSLCGLAASTLAYIASFSGGSIDSNLLWVVPLFFGAAAVIVPVRLLEPSAKYPNYIWTKFRKDMPRWVFPCLVLVWLFTGVHFAWFFFQTGLGDPDIRDGQYVLASRQEVYKVLTQSEYLAIKAVEARMFATVMFSMYLVPTMYWIFRRPEQKEG
jgi:hypothetical protein